MECSNETVVFHSPADLSLLEPSLDHEPDPYRLEIISAQSGVCAYTVDKRRATIRLQLLKVFCCNGSLGSGKLILEHSLEK